MLCIYSSYYSAGSSSQPIWLDNIICNSSSNCLAYCESCPATQYHNCRHSQDVALGCGKQILCCMMGSNRS